jgi:serine/threonine protein kinase/tetratricopeptide (TPR) repeat protein/WD40 repeat protein
MATSNSDRNPIEELAEEFAERYRRGERPSLTEYTDKHPGLAEEIRDLFPALVCIEQLKPAPADVTGAYDGGPVPAKRRLERLGDYRILREVGRGGMGIVYEAEQVSLGRHVALKVLPSQGLTNPTFLERFRREARAAARLHHTNIVPVFGVGNSEGVYYYAMQFIQGEGLDKVLHDLRRFRDGAAPLTLQQTQAESNRTGSVAEGLWTGRFVLDEVAFPQPEPDGSSAPPATSSSGAALAPSRSELPGRSEWEYCRSVARVGVQVAEALAYAHKQGILHRDIKPSNLLLDQQGTVWITDFGLAKAEGAGELTHTGDIVGTLRFMAPERFDGTSLPQSDVYGLGLTLYEMLTLRPAFEDSNRARLVEQVLREMPVRPRKLDRRIPRDLETIVLKAMAKDPADRYATAELLAEDLRRFLADRPIRARRSSLSERTWRWCRRNPVVATLAAMVILLLVVMTVGVLVRNAELRQALKDSDAARREIEEAQRKTDRQRWEATLEQAKANRLSRRPGQRIKTLQLLRQCAEEARALSVPAERRAELRNAVIATLAMPDLYLEEVGGPVGVDNEADFDGNVEHYAVTDEKGNCSVRRVAGDVELYRIPGTGKKARPYWSHSGRFLALNVDGGQVRLGERTDTGWQERLVLAANAICASFRRDDRLVAIAHGDGGISVYELPSLVLRYRLPPDTIGRTVDIDLHPTAPLVACASYFHSVLQVRDLCSGKVLAKLDRLAKPCKPAWHPDGRHLLAAEGEGSKIHEYEWDSSTPALARRRAFPTGSSSCGVGFNRTGDRFAASGWGHIMYLFDFETGHLLFQTPAMWRGLRPRFDVSGEWLAGAVAGQGDKLSVWRVGDARDHRTFAPAALEERQGFASAAVHPEGRLLATTRSRGGVDLWDLSSGRKFGFIPLPQSRTAHATFDRSGALYTTGWEGTFRWPVCPLADSGDRLQVGPPELLPFPRGAQELALSPDGRVRVKAYYNGYGETPYTGAWVQLGDRPGALTRILPGTSSVAASVSPDGRWIAISQHFGRVAISKVTDDERLERVTELPGSGSFCRFSRDGRWLWTGLNGGQLYHTGSWEPGPACMGHACAFSPAGNLLATTLATGHLTLFDSTTGRQLAQLEDPNLDVAEPPAFSPDGTRLITLTNGKVKGIHVWDLRRMRRALKEMDLDWDSPEYPPQPEARPLTQVDLVQPELARLPAGWQPPRPVSQAERWRRDVAVYSLAIALQPVNPEAYYRRGFALWHLQRPQEAVADLDMAQALRPRHTGTYHFRAHAHEDLQHWHQADADFTAALARKRDDAHLLEHRGRCRLQLKRVDDAIADLERALALKPDRLELVLPLARACNSRAWGMLTAPAGERDVPIALQLAKRAVQLRPGDRSPLNTLGVAQYRSALYQEAVVSLEKALAARQGGYIALDLYFLAMAHYRLGDRSKAQDCYDRAVRWTQEQEGKLPANLVRELTAFRAEAEALLKP